MSSALCGCTYAGKHVSSCADDRCIGCLPRVSETGILCSRCWQRLVRAVADVPSLVEHLTFLAYPSISSPSGKTGRSSPLPGSRSLYSPMLDAADEVASALYLWAREVAEKRGEASPPRDGWRFTSPPGRESEPWGGNLEAVEQAVGWLMPRLAWVAAQDWAIDMSRELHSLSSRCWRKWPACEAVRSVPAPCPKCGAFSLLYHPPVVAASPAMVTCSSPKCSAQWVGDTWTRYVSSLIEQAQVGGL